VGGEEEDCEGGSGEEEGPLGEGCVGFDGRVCVYVWIVVRGILCV
jgi:hypothetical protein